MFFNYGYHQSERLIRDIGDFLKYLRTNKSKVRETAIINSNNVGEIFISCTINSYNLTITFGINYPFAQPKIIFDDHIYHPNFRQNDPFKFENYNPAVSIQSITENIKHILKNPDVNCSCVYEREKNLYLRDVKSYNLVAEYYKKGWKDIKELLLIKSRTSVMPFEIWDLVISSVVSLIIKDK